MAGTDVSLTPRGALEPTLGQERIPTIDVLRGVAVLGILILNIRMFAQHRASYFNPTVEGGGVFTSFDEWTFWIVQLLGDQKFMSIFSMLFGAGIVLMAGRVVARGSVAWAVHYRRMFWLLVIGMVHAYLIWWGDILVSYAVCGMLLFGLWKFAPCWQLTIGVILLSLGGAIWAGIGLLVPWSPPEDLAELMAAIQPDVQNLSDYADMMLGAWLDQLGFRANESLEMQLFVIPAFMVWRAGGLMLIGMALFKWGVFDGRRSTGFYCTLLVICGVCGLALTSWTLQLNEAVEWSTPDVMFINGVPAYFGSVLTSLAWVSLVVVLARSARGIVSSMLAATGRMALTNYIAQSLLCSVLFHGWGVGLYGHLGYADQWLVIISIWILQLLWSLWWLRHFRFGPLEWLWRSLVLARRQPMLKEVAA